MQTTVREAREQFVARFFHMLNTHCPANVAPLLTDDVELVADVEARGQVEVQAYLAKLWEASPCLAFVPKHILLDGDYAAAEVTYSGGQDGKGARCFILRFRDDKIRRIRVY